jgi:hypothetical protein
MNAILTATILAGLFYAFWAPPVFVYIIGIIGIFSAVALVVATNSAMAPVKDSEHVTVNRLSEKLNKDATVSCNLSELYALLGIQVLNFIFLHEALLILLIGFGSIMVVKRLADYLEETYYDEIVLAMGNINNKKDK